jgi:hypothetical protein
MTFAWKKDCVFNYYIRELLVCGVHGDGLMGYYGAVKTLDVLHENFYWPKMKRDVQGICDRCINM